MAGDSADVTGDDTAASGPLSAAPVGYRTGLGTSDLESITLLGYDLADDLIGQITFGELAFWLMAKRRPAPGERTMSRPSWSPSPTTGSRPQRSPPG